MKHPTETVKYNIAVNRSMNNGVWIMLRQGPIDLAVMAIQLNIYYSHWSRQNNCSIKYKIIVLAVIKLNINACTRNTSQ